MPSTDLDQVEATMGEFVQRKRWVSLIGTILVLSGVLGVFLIGPRFMLIMLLGLALVTYDSMILS